MNKYASLAKKKQYKEPEIIEEDFVEGSLPTDTNPMAVPRENLLFKEQAEPTTTPGLYGIDKPIEPKKSGFQKALSYILPGLLLGGAGVGLIPSLAVGLTKPYRDKKLKYFQDLGVYEKEIEQARKGEEYQQKLNLQKQKLLDLNKFRGANLSLKNRVAQSIIQKRLQEQIDKLNKPSTSQKLPSDRYFEFYQDIANRINEEDDSLQDWELDLFEKLDQQFGNK